MTELLTAAQIRAMEQTAIDRGDVTGLSLMERAGRGVVSAIFKAWPELMPFEWDAHAWERGASPSRSPKFLRQEDGGAARKAAVFCGPGNNGGDGFVVARLLHDLGWDLEVFLYGDAAKLPPDASVNYKRWRALGDVVVRSPDAPALFDDAFSVRGEPALVVDALFGGGLSRPFKGPFAMLGLDSAQDRMRDLGVRRVAVDVPSGLCADSGRVIGQKVLPADLTVTFQAMRLGHVLDRGPELCGQVEIVDIGVPIASRRDIVLKTVPGKGLAKSSGHKFDHGHALVLAGGMAKTGAARLAARGALRIGAGLVTLAPPGSALLECAFHTTAIMLERCDGADALFNVLKDQRLNAICVGPGLGLTRARELVPTALDAKRATVLDADALSAFEADPARLFARLHDRCVLTPHGGEFRRLFPDVAKKLVTKPMQGPAFSKVDAAREAALRAGCVVLLKGHDTVIAAPDGRCCINAAVREHATPWLATAGSGDVLAGFITGLLARGFEPFEAAQAGAWLHVECARRFGPGLIAEDLPEQLPDVLRSLGC